MDNPAPAPVGVGNSKESLLDPVKAEGILAEVLRKNKYAANLWSSKWGFYKNLRKIEEEEAEKLGMTKEEYQQVLDLFSCKLPPKKCPVEVSPSPMPLPQTSSAMVGRRAQCPLERYGRLVSTARDYPTRPPITDPPYDPYKQTLVFLGSVEGDPISYALPAARGEVPEELWTRPHQLTVTPFTRENIFGSPS